LPALALEVAGRAGERGEWRRAAELLQLGYEALPTAERDELGLALAEARVRAGEYAQGLRALEGIEAGGKDQGQDAALALRVATLRGLALQRQGRLDEARQVLQKALEALETQPAWPAQRTGQAPDALDHHGDPVAGAAVEARALLGRVLLAQGGIGEARALCATALEPKAPAGRAGLPLLEVGGLAALYAGELDEAAACFAAAVERARAAEKKRVSSGTEGEARDRPEGQGREHGDGDARPWAPASGAADRLPRALACEGMACQARGDLAGAAERYQEAYQLAEQRGDVHGAAHYGANLGAVLREQGRLAEALAPSVTAVRRMVQLGHTAELPVAVYNLGNLLLTLGDLAGTVQELRLLQAESTRTDTPLAHGYLHLLAAELSVRIRREGRRAPRGLSGELRRPASALAREAEQWFARAGAPREAVYAAVTLVEALVAEGKATRAAEAVPALQRRAAALDDPLAPHTLCLARARIRLAGGALPELGEELRRSRDYLLEAQRPDLAWRAAVLCAAQAQQAEDPERLGRHITKALELALAQRERLPESYRDAWDRDPDAVRLARLERSVAPAARGTDSQRLGAGRSEAGRAGIGRTGIGRAGAAEPETAVLRRLLEINKRLNTEHRLPILLELVLDAVLELIDAERGFILLQGEGDALEVRVARNMDRRNLGAGERSLSRSIAEDAAARGEPVMTVDAAMDERFSDAVSVHGLRLRSVLAVPLRVKGRVVGTVYVDNRLRRGAFQQADLALVQDFAQQAAIAIDNARLHEELVVKRRRIEELNRELASKVERQEAEIADMRTELKESQAALRVRYDYSNIVGESPGMLELFRLLDRITDVELPVVIHGESGTGKELVARAIHHNGPRSERPFVSENCGALPETLLESILFGHVKGAFTGADRDRKGLFEVAHGGTLFLDEVGEMSPAMQTKLLRVLQDGEVRRVGGDRVVQVDVRIIAASNQKLDQLVDRGSFRQDLYYRLNVLSVELPPLRERPEDLPLLVEHFIQKYSADRPRRLSRGALDRLLAHPWPGNVRELENEIQRVLALGGDLIGEADLSGAIRGGEDPPLRADDLDVRRHVELLERDLLRRALERTEGNQTRAAKLLGLSRYGLLKKLRRYDMLPSTGSE
jgi:transcriptional regulator with GAF, ATPase, and Fis domain/tetratricopeptide (TPR) repeat protein